MKIKCIEAENLFSWKDLHLYLDDQSNSLQGLNGSGKSSIFEIILWVLFKKTTKKHIKGDYGKTDGYGTVFLKDMKIRRETSSPNTVYMNDEPVEQEQLEEFLGGNFAIFMSSNMCSQERVSSFINESSDSGKAKIFGEMIGCGRLDKIRSKVQIKRNKYEVEYESALTKVQTLEDALEECKLELDDMSLKKFKESIVEDKEALFHTEEVIKKANLEKKQAIKVNELWNAYENNLKIVKQNKADIEVKEKQITDIKLKMKSDQYEDLDSRVESNESEIKSFEDDLKTWSIQRREKQSRISELKNIIAIQGSCPTCGSKVSDSHKNHIALEIRKLKQEIEKIQPSEKFNSKLKSKKIELRELSKLEMKYSDLEYQLSITESEIEIKEKQNKTLRKNLNKPKCKRMHLEELVNIIENKARRASILLKGIENKERIVKALNKANSQLEEAKEVYNKYKKLFTVYNWLFKHIPLMKLRYINENKLALEEIINQYISSIGLPFIVKIDTQKELKSKKELKEAFSFKIINTNSNRVVDNKDLSGGEKICILLATQFAISDIAGTNLDFEIYDEIYGPLDDKNLDRVVTMLRERSEKVQLFSISHKDEISKSFDNIIHIYKKDGYSYVR
jgi:DNA repair exonuclease SbcCD ATPase subunit